MNLSPWLKRVQRLSCGQLGVNPQALIRSLRGTPRFLRDYVRFRSAYRGRLELYPCLHDWEQEGGVTRNEYFWQDLLVARMIFAASPRNHADVGSRIDGFVAHLATFRDIDVFDIRPVTTSIPGVRFRQADLMQTITDLADCYDSVSCLHALEHFGLGRYGDPVDPDGFARGFGNLARLLKESGVLYLSVPVGIERVEFNGLRVSDPRRVLDLAGKHSLRLSRLTTITPEGSVESLPPDNLATRLDELAGQRYCLAIFNLVKCSAAKGIHP